MPKYCSDQNNETGYLTPHGLLKSDIQEMAVVEVREMRGVFKNSKEIINVQLVG